MSIDVVTITGPGTLTVTHAVYDSEIEVVTVSEPSVTTITLNPVPVTPSVSVVLDGMGIPGVDGADGTNGIDGIDGDSAFEIAAANGFVGDELAWLASLVGAQGAQGEQGIQGETGAQGIQGIQGDEGPQGIQGIQGETGPEGPEGPAGVNTWGSITGTLSSQTDLQSALNAKASSASLSTVATSGAYNDLSGKPTLGTAAAQNTSAFDAAGSAAAAQATAVQRSNHTGTQAATTIVEDSTHRFATDAEKTSWNAKQAALGFTPENTSNKATNLTSPDDTKFPTTLAVSSALSAKQNTLVSGTSIKSINGTSLLGSGDLTISGGGGGSGVTEAQAIAFAIIFG